MAGPDTTPLSQGKVCFPPCEANDRCIRGVCIPFKCDCKSFEKCNADKVCVEKIWPPKTPPVCLRLCDPETQYCNSLSRTCEKIPGCPKCPAPLVCDPGRKYLLKGLSHEIDLINFDKKFPELCLTKGSGWFFNFLGAPMILHCKKFIFCVKCQFALA
jgi:hypothetical protein